MSAALLALLLFAFGALPALQRLGPVREVNDAIRRSGVDATALFYTESELAREAEATLRDAMKHADLRAARGKDSADPTASE